jgi:hypothetical protein
MVNVITAFLGISPQSPAKLQRKRITKTRISIYLYFRAVIRNFVGVWLFPSIKPGERRETIAAGKAKSTIFLGLVNANQP